MNVCMYVYMHACVCVCVCVCVRVLARACMYARMRACMYVHTYCVLIKPPMPYITSSPLCLLRGFESYLNLALQERTHYFLHPHRCVCFVFLRPI